MYTGKALRGGSDRDSRASQTPGHCCLQKGRGGSFSNCSNSIALVHSKSYWWVWGGAVKEWNWWGKGTLDTSV